MMEKWRKMGNTKYNGEMIPEKLVGWVLRDAHATRLNPTYIKIVFEVGRRYCTKESEFLISDDGRK